MAHLTEQEVNDLRKGATQIARRHNLKLVVLYGSTASGKAGPESDVDIAVLGHEPISLRQLIDLNNDFMDLLAGREVDVKSLHRTGPLFRYQVMKDAIRLYGDKREFDSLKIYAFRDYCESGPLFRLKEDLLQKRLAALGNIQ